MNIFCLTFELTLARFCATAITQELGALVEVFCGGCGGAGVGRQESETAGKLYYCLTLYNKHMVSEWKIFSFWKKDLEIKNRLGTNSIDYISVNTVRKFYKIE